MCVNTFQMLIYFFSDRNYVRQGFYARYLITNCPYNCSDNGECLSSTHTCQCDPGFTGEGCELATCPNMCNENGICDPIPNECRCEEHYFGHDCGISVNKTTGWKMVSPPGVGFQARAGHSGVFMETLNRLYVFGGSSLNGLLGELIYFSFSSNIWEMVPRTSPWPEARHGHAMAVVENHIFIYGGIVGNDQYSDELWEYDINSMNWRMVGLGCVRPAGVTSHTLTVVDDKFLYLFGGRSGNGDFVSDMYRISVHNLSCWERINARGGRTADHRLVGHSTVYHKESRSLLVFGGFLTDNAKFPKRSASLHAFHLDKNWWSEIVYDFQLAHVPKERAFHQAVIIGNYMVVHGGNIHIHHEEERCYDSQLYFYHLGCHIWVNYAELAKSHDGMLFLLIVVAWNCLFWSWLVWSNWSPA